MNANLDPINSWCEYYEPKIFFFQDHNDVQCSMGYGLLTLWISIQCPNIGRNVFPINSYVVDFEFMIVIEFAMVQIIKFVEDKKNLHIHENKIVKSTLWTYRIDGVYVCTIVLYY
jgi:hypothetical protein